MPRYILVYNINDCPAMGGGAAVELFNKESDMHARVNELAIDDERISIKIAGWLHHEYEYKPIDVVRKYEPHRKD